MPRGLYIHIPFCKTRCHYCNFISFGETTPEFRERFFKALFEEVREAGKKYGQLFFDTLYLGGGTPSLLNAQEMTGLFGEVRKNFEISQDAEITCEWNPGDGEEEKFSVLRALGVNRLSLGVQSFQDGLLSQLGRRHTVHDTLRTLEKIQKAGIGNISFDLMLRIPGQKLADFQESLERCVACGAAQVSLYDLEVHKATVFGGLREKGALALPDEEEHAGMYQAACEGLVRAGYEHYEISNFARPGFASRHNLIYWHNQEYLGLGPGAFSYLGGIRSQFAGEGIRYLEKCEAGDWRNDQEDVLSEAERETETFAMGLRLAEGVKLRDFPGIYPGLRERVETLLQKGLLELADEELRLTAWGRFLSEDIFGFLLQKDRGSEACFL